MSQLLKTEELSIGYLDGASRKILQENINVSINTGEIIGLLGQNGVGKTTFIKTICGILPSLSGEIYYGNKKLSEISRNALSKKISVVLTEKPPIRNLTVYELIALGRLPYSNWLGMLSKEDKQAVNEAVDQTRINYIINKKLIELSDGQLQKVLIARALAQQTELIYLDEPTVHLDLHNKIEIMLLLKDIASTGKGMLISTHDLQVCNQLADQLWLFNFNEQPISGITEDLILNGMVEETLFLKEYQFDMIKGISYYGKKTKSVHVDGPENIRHWTEQALNRNNFRLVKSNPDILIEISDGIWTIKRDDNQEIKVDSIEALLNTLT
jgi:iron complex transport system ATP-binding protein